MLHHLDCGAQNLGSACMINLAVKTLLLKFSKKIYARYIIRYFPYKPYTDMYACSSLSMGGNQSVPMLFIKIDTFYDHKSIYVQLWAIFFHLIDNE